ncbi:MAG: Mu transposase C-terminal domain-containing protein [Candidatus Gastranaerophilaceae bacterium]|nr:Mu transposase C-terminal domain-containing protein [Candidatus Gastranaerophilaceae bacterium]
MTNFTPEKCKQIALARLDIVHKWLEFRKQFQNKLQADYDFVKLHNTSNSYLFEILGKISRGSLHRWYSMLNGTEDYTKLLPQYKYSSVNDYRTVLNDDEIKIFFGLLLHPNRLSIGKAIALTKYKLKEQGQSFIPADITFRRYAKWFKDNNYDKWILARDGEKALSDKVEPYIKRDASLLDVGDILVADGHKLAFQVINPFTGKPCRATLVGFLDWKSTALVSYEIMLEENTQCIASALRNAIINLDMIPKVVYQDNGRAFRAKYFTDDKGFTELGFQGLYSKLGIETVFARPYNARAKVIERFFKEFQEGFEKLLPSYIGSSIANKPAYMMRNEKLHKSWHNEYIPTIEETIKMIDMWLSFKNSQPCPNTPNKTIAEVLAERKRQNIEINTLDDLMLATEVKTIQRNGIRFLNCDYFDERLYGFKSKVIIKYNLFDLTSIKVYTPKGEYLCTAERVTETHPMVKLLGDVKDYEDYKQKIVRQRQLKKKTVESVKKYLQSEDIKLLETQVEQSDSHLPLQMPFKLDSKRVQTLFKNNSEKYEYLIKNDPNNSWITEFKQTKEYQLLYEENIC